MNANINNNLFSIINKIFIIYIIILIRLDIININQSVKILFSLYKYNYFDIDNDFFIEIFNKLKLINDSNLNIFNKYFAFIYIISTIDNHNIKFLKLINKSKLFKNTKKILNLDKITSNLLSNITEDYYITKKELENIKIYLNSFEIINNKNNFLKQFLSIKNNFAKIAHTNEIISRIELLYEMIGYNLINMILNKKERKKKKEDNFNNINIILHTKEELCNMEYTDLIKYIYILFLKIDKNIDSYIIDFEFVKYLKIIIITYIQSDNDNIPNKFLDKIIKKYIFL